MGFPFKFQDGKLVATRPGVNLRGEFRLKPGAAKELTDLGLDPTYIGIDGQLHQGVASIQYLTQSATFSGGGTPSIAIPRNTFITDMIIVADPFQTIGDGTTAGAAVIVEDAQDRVLQGLAIVGGPQYYSHSDAVLGGRALGNLNKQVYGGSLVRQDISTASATATVNNYESWRLHFGALNDLSPFTDGTAGIPAEDETMLNLNFQFSTNSVLATNTAIKVLQTATNFYVILMGINGMDPMLRLLTPIPDFRTDIVATPTSQTTLNLLGNRFLKRSTIINQASAASNNNARNDSNVTDFSIQLLKPTTIKMPDRARWNVAKSWAMSLGGRWPSVDANGTIVVQSNGLAGVLTIDWRKITGNPFGLDLFPNPAQGVTWQTGDAAYVLTMGATTGQVSVLHEYYSIRDARTIQLVRNWQRNYAFQPV